MIKIVLKEIRYRKLNFIFSVVAVTVAVASIVAFYTMTKESWNETRRLTRDMGYNLRIISKKTNMIDFWKNGYSTNLFSQDNIKKLIPNYKISYAHLTGILHKEYNFHGKSILVTGVAPDMDWKMGKKTSMIFQIKPKEAYIGYEISLEFGLKKGDGIELLGEKFIVGEVLSETGSERDSQVYLNLETAQRVFNLENQITEIKALNCLCLAKGKNPIDLLRAEIESLLPNAKVVMNNTISVARKRQREMVEAYFSYLLPFFIKICFLWLSALFIINVNSRKEEIGIFKSLGYTSFSISSLFVVRALVIGIIGALFGFLLGTLFSVITAESIFIITYKAVTPIFSLLGWVLLFTPLVTIISVVFPSVLALSNQVVDSLRDN
jgi:putative ABC transport system permease protein